MYPPYLVQDVPADTPTTTDDVSKPTDKAHSKTSSAAVESALDGVVGVVGQAASLRITQPDVVCAAVQVLVAIWQVCWDDVLGCAWMCFHLRFASATIFSCCIHSHLRFLLFVKACSPPTCIYTTTQGGAATARPLRVLRTNKSVWQGIVACVVPPPPTKPAPAREGGDEGQMEVEEEDAQGVRAAQQMQLQAAALHLLALEMCVWGGFAHWCMNV